MPIASVLMVDFEVDPLYFETEKKVIEQSLVLIAETYSSSLAQIGFVSEYDVMQRYLVFTQSAYAFLAYRMLEQMIYPVKLRGAIGLGKIEIDDDGKITGPVFQIATKALQQTKEISPTAVLFSAGFVEDNLINMQLLNWTRLKENQSDIARLFSWAYEVQIPLTISEATTQEDFDEPLLVELEASKLPLFTSDDKPSNYEKIDFSLRKPVKWLEVHVNLESDSYLIEGLYRKGYATAIAKMANTSRQNVDYHLKNGEFSLERNLAASLLLQLEREEAAIDFDAL